MNIQILNDKEAKRVFVHDANNHDEIFAIIAYDSKFVRMIQMSRINSLNISQIKIIFPKIIEAIEMAEQLEVSIRKNL